MKQLSFITIAALAVGFSCASAMAENMPEGVYQTNRTKISSEYTAARAACDRLSGNLKDICVVEAKGHEKVASAELEALHKPSIKAQYKLSEAKANATYAVTKERCDDLSGNVKSICIKEAQLVQTQAKAAATVKMKTDESNTKADTKAMDAHEKAQSVSIDAHKDAIADTKDARYALEKEKCEQFTADAKTTCLTQAKARFEQP